MTGRPKPKPLQAFEANMADAHHLVRLAEGLTNRRTRAMRKERRERVGAALDIANRRRDQLDCLESDDFFLVFLPGAKLCRKDFEDHRPLLRQALVAACAATETYVADKVMEKIGPMLTQAAATDRLRKVPMSLGDWLQIDEQYERRGWGRRQIVERYVREQSSTASYKVGAMLSLLGVQDWSKHVDRHRNVNKGDTVKFLDRVTERRNRIAHEGDRSGRGRAPLEIEEVKGDLAALESVVIAIEALVEDDARVRKNGAQVTKETTS